MTDIAIYRLYDVLFVVVHSALIAFNMLGWAWRRTRRLHLVTIGATLVSWFGLGVTYGWGYCPLTDWHWRIKLMLGETALPASWIKYYLDRITGIDWSPWVVDVLVVGSALAALVLSVVLNHRDRRGSVSSLACRRGRTDTSRSAQAAGSGDCHSNNSGDYR